MKVTTILTLSAIMILSTFGHTKENVIILEEDSALWMRRFMFDSSLYNGDASMSFQNSPSPLAQISDMPSASPSTVLSVFPTDTPSKSPLAQISDLPSARPSKVLSVFPTDTPSKSPSHALLNGSLAPSQSPSIAPSKAPLCATKHCFNAYVYCPGISTTATEYPWQLVPADYSLENGNRLNCDFRAKPGVCGPNTKVVGSFTMTKDTMNASIFEENVGIQTIRLAAPVGGPAPVFVSSNSLLTNQVGGSYVQDGGFTYIHAQLCPCAQIAGGCPVAKDTSSTTSLNDQTDGGSNPKTTTKDHPTKKGLGKAAVAVIAISAVSGAMLTLFFLLAWRTKKGAANESSVTSSVATPSNGRDDVV